MARLLRSDLPDGYYHVTANAVPEAWLFRDDDDRRLFLALLVLVADRYCWHIHAYCLMGTHYHLVLEASRERLSEGMRRLNGTYARRFNKRHGRRGHLFEERFASYVIRDEQHLQAAITYVLQNPVRAGLCAEAADWQWAAAMPD